MRFQRRYKEWTQEDIQALRDGSQLPHAELTALLGRTPSSIYTKAVELKISLHKSARSVRRDKKALEYAKAYSVSYRRVQRVGTERLDVMSEEARRLLLGISGVRKISSGIESEGA